MSEVILYGPDASSYLWSVRFALAEKGVPYSLEPVDPTAESYRQQLHPFGKVPAMRHGDITLFESFAILRYVDEVFAGPPLQPSTLLERARMTQWVSAFSDYIYRPMIRDVVIERAAPQLLGRPTHEEGVAKAMVTVEGHVAILDRALEGRELFAGPSLSLADIIIAPAMHYFSLAGGRPVLARHKNVEAWLARVTARPAFQASLPAMLKAPVATAG